MYTNEKPKFYGRRQGRKIRKAKSGLLERFLPQTAIEKGKTITKDIFGTKIDEIYLEIGFGNGEHIAGQSQKHHNIGFIGAEVFKNGVANLLTLMTGIKENSNMPEEINILSDRVDNVRIWSDDVRILFSQIPDGLLSKVFLLFPDPWPKKRHASRRFINPDNLKEIARMLKKGGILRVATDHKVYKGWTLRRLHEDPNFKWTAKTSDDWRNPPADWFETKYQRKAIREGRKPVFLDFERI
jgi:tRNA (guanine-N7-)-methyltransferase